MIAVLVSFGIWLTWMHGPGFFAEECMEVRWKVDLDGDLDVDLRDFAEYANGYACLSPNDCGHLRWR